MLRSLALLAALLLPGFAAEPLPPKALEAVARRLRPLHAPMAKPVPGDWLTQHVEPGQTFRQYLASAPHLPRAPRRTLYLQPLGAFTEGQRRILDGVKEGLAIYLGLPVVLNPAIPESRVPADAQRISPGPGGRQFLTSFLLYDLLKPALPQDAAACIGLCAADLWPGDGWAFVFGIASRSDRVGVWSLARLGRPDQGPEAFRLCLLRALGTAVHETLHMFGFRHCTAFECVMNGSNSLEEGDRHPFWLCPECQAKLWFAAEGEPGANLEALGSFCARQGWMREASFFQASTRRLKERLQGQE